MRNGSSQLAGLQAGLTVGLLLFSAHVVTRKILVAGVDGLLSVVCISWIAAIMATYLVSAIYFRKKIESGESIRLAERCLLYERMREIEDQLETVTKENSHLHSTLGSIEQEDGLGQGNNPIAIESDTFSRICRAISAFPTRYPEYAIKPPKLDGDVRPWLKEVDVATNDREAVVFSTIIAEHFKLSSGSLKPQ